MFLFGVGLWVLIRRKHAPALLFDINDIEEGVSLWIADKRNAVRDRDKIALDQMNVEAEAQKNMISKRQQEHVCLS